MGVVSERERAIDYVKNGLVGHYDSEDFKSGMGYERLLCLLEGMTDEAYLETFVFCSCNKKEEEKCHRLI